MTDNGYMSDSEIDALIAEVEDQGLVEAPPEMLACVLELVEEATTATDAQKKELPKMEIVEEISKPPRNKVVEFRNYCIRVASAAAAAVILLAVVPELINNNEWANRTETEIPARETIIKESLQTKEEFINSRENSLSGKMQEPHFLSDVLTDNKIFN